MGLMMSWRVGIRGRGSILLNRTRMNTDETDLFGYVFGVLISTAKTQRGAKGREAFAIAKADLY